MDTKKTLIFSDATNKKLSNILKIKKIAYNKKFDEWFNYKYQISESENNFIKRLIEKNQLYLFTYNESKLTIKFIAPILNKIDFDTKNFTDWYNSEIRCKLNGYTLYGKPYLIVATGIEEPEKPFFFLQEYKKSLNPSGNPEYQVIAAMITAMTLNNAKIIRGSYVIGRIWYFVILEKDEENYKYYVSESFDALKINDLKQIFINLKAIKFFIMKNF